MPTVRFQYLAIAGLVFTGCTPDNSAVQRSRAALQEPSGTYAFYAGKGIGDLLRNKQSVPDDLPTPFMRLRVPAAFVDAAMGSVQHVRTVSFEEVDSSIEATVRWFPHKNGPNDLAMETLVFHPGDPWVSGYAQVGTAPDGFTMGLFEIIKWYRDPSGTMPTAFAQQIHTTGLLPDDNIPTLRYADDPTKAPLPESWK